MASGKSVLRELDKDLRDLRGSVSKQAEALSLSSRYLADVRQEQAQAMRDLARIHLDQIQEQAVAGEIDSSNQLVKQLLAKHAELLEQARDSMRAGADAITELEQQREAQEEVHERAESDLQAAIAATRSRLEKDTTYTSQADAVREAQATADHAAQKSEQAQRDRLEKGEPYESDPLFMYLWRRKYGTDAYSAFPLFRTLDGWVARLCKYDRARRNYGVLIEIPVRLKEHSDRVAELAALAEEELERIEREAFTADGHDAKRVSVEQARERLTELDDEMETAEARHLDATREHTLLANGNDPTYRKALDKVLATLRARDLAELRKEVEQTPLPEDDILVEKLMELEQEETILAARVRQENESVHGTRKLLGDLEWIRNRFKRSRFDSAGSRFDGEDFLPGLVSQLSRRTISRESFWTYLARRHRDRHGARGRSGRRRRGAGFGGFGNLGDTIWALASLADVVIDSGGLGSSLSGGSSSTRGLFGGGSFGGGGSFRGGGSIGGGGFKTGGGF